MRIAVGGILHESSTFIDSPTTIRDFEAGFGVFRGPDVAARFRGANICTGGFLEGAERHGFEAVPLLWAFAYPGGPVGRQDYQALKEEFLDRLREAEAVGGRIDGALLDLHGAMVVEGIDDGDGDFLAAVREYLGPDRPIITTYDLHGNHTRSRVELADALIGFDTYPHVDMAERGREAADLIVRQLRREVRPTMAIRQIPLLWSAACQVTAHPPMDEVLDRVHHAERRPGVLSVTISTGFPWADVPEHGASVIAVTNSDPQLARSVADELGGWIWDHRERFYQHPPTVRQALDAGHQAGRFPIILADMDDNTGGGAPGDSTEVLRTFLELGLTDALVLYMVDPAVAHQAHAVGVGKKIQVSLGGKSDPRQGPPVKTEAEVASLSAGQFAYDGPMYSGLTGNMGTSALLKCGGVSVVVVTAREQPLDPAFARTLGIDCAAMRYIAVKSAAHFRSGFERMAGSIYNISAQAIHSHDFRRIDLRRSERPLYPRGEQDSG